MTTPLLHATDLSVAWGAASPVLRGFSASLVSGALTVVGESGAGKSSLLAALMGEARIASGAIQFGGTTLRPGDGPPLAWRRSLGVVLQNPRASLDPRLTAMEAVTGPLQILEGYSPERARQAAAAALGSVGVPPDRWLARPAQLSGGECQRIAIARAMARPIRLLLADEPTANLDPENSALVMDLLARIADTPDVGVLLVTHRLDEAVALGGTVTVLLRGEQVETIPGFHGWSQALHPYTRALAGLRPS